LPDCLGAAEPRRGCPALVRRKLGVTVNRKRVLRVLREQGLIQRRRSVPRRRRPGCFRVERPEQLWHLDMTSIWVAEHGCCYLNAIIDCCTRELVGWSLDVRCRAGEAIAVFEAAIVASGFVPDELEVGDEAERLTLGTDNGTAFTSRAFRAALAERDVAHRRGGHRDPESQAFIESGFAKRKEREVWLNEYETLNDARRAIAAYVDRYHHRPHGGLDYKTPLEVRQTWEDLQKQAARTVNSGGVQSSRRPLAARRIAGLASR
jgi:putative transposase